MILAIFGLLIGMTLLELYVVIQVGHAIGWGLTFGLMVLDAIIGSMLMRSQGRSVWARFRETLAAGRPPAREVLDGSLVIAGGAFLITPGFVTDIVGGLLLIPPSRAVARRWVVRHFTGRLLGPVAGGWVRNRAGGYGRRAGGYGQSAGGYGRRTAPGGGAGWGRPPAGPPPPGGGPPAVPYDVEGEAIELGHEELER